MKGKAATHAVLVLSFLAAAATSLSQEKTTTSTSADTTKTIGLTIVGSDPKCLQLPAHATPIPTHYFADSADGDTVVRLKAQFSWIYPGISMACYSDEHQMEYVFQLAPFADPGQIRFSVGGVKQVAVDEADDIVAKFDGGEIIQSAPLIYQQLATGKNTTSPLLLCTLKGRRKS